MSKALSRVHALVSEIDAIQSKGRTSSASVPIMKSVQPEHSNVLPLKAPVHDHPPQGAVSNENKVTIQLTGKVALQLKLENSDEIVEVRQKGESIEIRFSDGKAIHLPLKSVA